MTRHYTASERIVVAWNTYYDIQYLLILVALCVDSENTKDFVKSLENTNLILALANYLYILL